MKQTCTKKYTAAWHYFGKNEHNTAPPQDIPDDTNNDVDVRRFVYFSLSFLTFKMCGLLFIFHPFMLDTV